MRTIYLSFPTGELHTDIEKSFFEFIIRFFQDIAQH